MARCAECKTEFSHRNLRENLRFNRLLEIWRNLRTQNNLNTQIPTSFKAFDPQEAARQLRERKEKQEAAARFSLIEE